MRGLQTSDLFTFSRLITKMNLKQELKDIFVKKEDDNEEPKAEKNDSILDLVLMIIERVETAEQEFYNFIVPISEKTIDEIKAQSLDDTFDLLISIYTGAEFPSFLKFTAKSRSEP